MIIKFLLVIAISYLIGKYKAHRDNRKQCLNCGGYNTERTASGMGGGGGEYKYAVTHWEGHDCKDCGKQMSVQIKLMK